MANNTTSFRTIKITRHTTVKIDEMHIKFIINKRMLTTVANFLKNGSINSTSVN